MSDKRYYTYVWFSGDRPIYVGKGCGERYLAHSDKAWFHAYDVEPRLFAGLSEPEALALESTLIERFGLDNLANRDGGSRYRCDLTPDQERFASQMSPRPFYEHDVTRRIRRARRVSRRTAPAAPMEIPVEPLTQLIGAAVLIVLFWDQLKWVSQALAGGSRSLGDFFLSIFISCLALTISIQSVPTGGGRRS